MVKSRNQASPGECVSGRVKLADATKRLLNSVAGGRRDGGPIFEVAARTAKVVIENMLASNVTDVEYIIL